MKRALAGAVLVTALALAGCASSNGSSQTVPEPEPTAASVGVAPGGQGLREIQVALADGRTVTCLTALWGDVPLLDCDWDGAR